MKMPGVSAHWLLMLLLLFLFFLDAKVDLLDSTADARISPFIHEPNEKSSFLSVMHLTNSNDHDGSN
eukprot:scaffold8136_cov127-Cylindrotheca_fusiformis.AAC.23